MIVTPSIMDTIQLLPLQTYGASMVLTAERLT